MHPIDFTARLAQARARAEQLAQSQTAYVDVEFTPSELAPRATLADLLSDCITEVGVFGVREEILK